MEGIIFILIIGFIYYLLLKYREAFFYTIIGALWFFSFIGLILIILGMAISLIFFDGNFIHNKISTGDLIESVQLLAGGVIFWILIWFFGSAFSSDLKTSINTNKSKSNLTDSSRNYLERYEAEKTKKQKEWDAFLRKQEIILTQNKTIAEEKARLKKILIKETSNWEKLDSRGFEIATAELYKNLGYNVTLTPQSNDGGKDIVMTKNGKTYLIECKKYALDNKVGRRDIQRFFTAIYQENAELGFFITTSTFTQNAIDCADEVGSIKLIDRAELFRLINQVYKSNDNSLIYKSICNECGDEVFFDLGNESDNNKMECKNKHVVRATMSFSKVFS